MEDQHEEQEHPGKEGAPDGEYAEYLDYPRHVTDAWAEWRRLSPQLAAWSLLSGEQRQRFASVISVAVGPAEGECGRLREANDNLRAELRTHIEAIMKLNDAREAGPEPASQWAVIEMMGHRVIIGRVRECMVADVAMLHVERPDGITQLVAPQSLFCITDVTEAVARKAHDRQALGYGLPHPLTSGIRFDGKQYTHGLPSGDPASPWRENPFGDDDGDDDPWHSDGGDRVAAMADGTPWAEDGGPF